MRSRVLKLRLTEEEWADAQGVAHVLGLNVSAALRFLMHREHLMYANGSKPRAKKKGKIG
jgi:hypothetical protein